MVVPLSTVPNWIKEFRKWTPQLNALVYVGDSKSREVIRSYEFYNRRGAARPYRFEVMSDFRTFVAHEHCLLFPVVEGMQVALLAPDAQCAFVSLVEVMGWVFVGSVGRQGVYSLPTNAAFATQMRKAAFEGFTRGVCCCHAEGNYLLWAPY